MRPIRKAEIPAAGFDIRFLPFDQTVPIAAFELTSVRSEYRKASADRLKAFPV